MRLHRDPNSVSEKMHLTVFQCRKHLLTLRIEFLKLFVNALELLLDGRGGLLEQNFRLGRGLLLLRLLSQRHQSVTSESWHGMELILVLRAEVRHAAVTEDCGGSSRLTGIALLAGRRTQLRLRGEQRRLIDDADE